PAAAWTASSNTTGSRFFCNMASLLKDKRCGVSQPWDAYRHRGRVVRRRREFASRGRYAFLSPEIVGGRSGRRLCARTHSVAAAMSVGVLAHRYAGVAGLLCIRACGIVPCTNASRLTMNTNADYVAAMDTQLKKWNADVDALAAKGDEANAEAR